MNLEPGDIVLVNFPFTDLLSSKVRPALVVTSKGSDVIILGIFSKIPDDLHESHLLIEETKSYFGVTGLKKSSIIKTEKIAVIHNSNIRKKLGRLPEEIFNSVKTKLKNTLGL